MQVDDQTFIHTQPHNNLPKQGKAYQQYWCLATSQCILWSTHVSSSTADESRAVGDLKLCTRSSVGIAASKIVFFLLRLYAFILIGCFDMLKFGHTGHADANLFCDFHHAGVCMLTTLQRSCPCFSSVPAHSSAPSRSQPLRGGQFLIKETLQGVLLGFLTFLW